MPTHHGISFELQIFKFEEFPSKLQPDSYDAPPPKPLVLETSLI